VDLAARNAVAILLELVHINGCVAPPLTSM